MPDAGSFVDTGSNVVVGGLVLKIIWDWFQGIRKKPEPEGEEKFMTIASCEKTQSHCPHLTDFIQHKTSVNAKLDQLSIQSQDTNIEVKNLVSHIAKMSISLALLAQRDKA